VAVQKITEFTAITTADPVDILPIVNDIPGVPVTRKITTGSLLDSYNDAAAEVSAAVTPSDYRFDSGNSRRVGDVGNGTTDDRDALNTADSIANVRIAVGADYGTHLISSDLTFNNKVTIWPGEILKPANSVTITFDKFVNANDSEQIFDLSLAGVGTAIVWPAHDRYDVPAAWFGAIPTGNATKNDQDVEINYAINSLAARGGVIKLALGDYFCTDRIQVQENVTLKGVLNRGTNLRVSTTNWSGAFDHLILFQDGTGTTSMFNARLVDILVDAENNATVVRAIWARAWNENCGLFNVVVRNFMVAGLELTNYYGGSATSELNTVEFFASNNAVAATQFGIRLVDPGLTVGWHQFLMSHIVSVGNPTNGVTNFFGLFADGRVRVINKGGFHSEKALSVIALSGDSTYEGIGPQASGNADVNHIFTVASNWNAGAGDISCTPPKKGGSTGDLLQNNSAIANIASSTANPFVYPFVVELTEVVTTTNVITSDETGKTFYLNLAGGFTSTLPAPSVGLKFKFIVQTAPTTAYIITTNAGANILFGTFIDIVGELTYFSAQDTLNFVASTSVVGDRLEVESDGTNWFCKAISGADGGITVSVT